MRDQERPKASREALEGAPAELEGSIGSSALARSARRVADHFAGRDAVNERDGGTDPAELWVAASAARCVNERDGGTDPAELWVAASAARCRFSASSSSPIDSA